VVLVLVLLFCTARQAYAQVSPPAEPPGPFDAQASAPVEPPGPFEASGHVAFVQTRGNTATQSLGAGGDLVWRPNQWTEFVKAAFAQAESGDALTARSVTALDRLSRPIGARLSTYGQYDFYRNLFSGVEQRHVAEGGVSYLLVQMAHQRVRLDAGLGYLDEHRPKERLQSASFAPAAEYRLVISPTSQFSYTPRFVFLFSDATAWKFDGDMALTAALNSVLAIKLSHMLRYSNRPSEGFERTDSTLSASLVIKMRSR
jgi:putative salt-induced outer membrane protein YdiY